MPEPVQQKPPLHDLVAHIRFEVHAPGVGAGVGATVGAGVGAGVSSLHARAQPNLVTLILMARHSAGVPHLFAPKGHVGTFQHGFGDAMSTHICSDSAQYGRPPLQAYISPSLQIGGGVGAAVGAAVGGVGAGVGGIVHVPSGSAS
jgi:hypothetical protein